MTKKLLAVVVFSLLSGCASIIGTETTYLAWRGEELYKGKGGAVESFDGVEFWEVGEPDRPYKVVGVIRQRKSEDSMNKKLFGEYTRKQITDLVKANNGDGVVRVASEKFISGYTHGNGTTSADHASSSVLAVFRYTKPSTSDAASK